MTMADALEGTQWLELRDGSDAVDFRSGQITLA
jgi:hypothetical protein